MKRVKFLGLTSVSCLSSIMLVIDGVFSRLAANNFSPSDFDEQINDFAFWPLWLPLLLVQVVVIALAYRGELNSLQRNIVIFMIFLFLAASMYSLIGHEMLTTEIARH